MWSKFTENKYSSTSTGTHVYTQNAIDPDVVKKGNWIIVSPFSGHCEIRKILDIVFPDKIIVNQALTGGWHANGETIYFQTSPNWDITLFGARAEDVLGTYEADNTTAINAAIADCKVNTDLDSGIVSIPVGTYNVQVFGGNDCCIYLENVNNIKFIGEGTGISIIKLFQGELVSTMSIFHLFASNNIEWHDLTLDGNKYIISDIYCDLITIEPPDDSEIVNNFIINRVQFVNALGKGINAKNIDKIHVLNSRFEENLKNGIHIWGISKNSWINGNYFYNNEDHDLMYIYEDTAEEVGRNIITENNFTNTLGIGGISIWCWGAAYSLVTDKFIVSDNVIEGRSLEILAAINALISNNIVIGGGNIPFKASATIINLNVENNVFVNNSTEPYAMLLTNDTIYTIQGAIITGNTLENGGCHLVNCKDIVFTNNKVKQGDFSNNKGLTFEITADPGPGTIEDPGLNIGDFGNLLITNNLFGNINDTGIDISSVNASYQFKLICIDTNQIQGGTAETTILYGIHAYIVYPSTSSIFWTKALIGTSNNIYNARIPIEVIAPYLVEQNPYQETWISNGSPETVLAAPQGSFAIDKSIEADNKYEKCSLEGNNLGWMLLSELYLQILILDRFPSAGTGTISGSTPEKTVFSSVNWGVSPTNAWLFAGGAGTKPNNTLSSPVFATYNSKPDGELKIIVLDSGSTSGQEIGILFRSNNGTPSTYWKFYIKKINSSTYEVVIGNNTTSSVHSCGNYEKATSGKTVLKVIMMGDYFSFFYNDLNVFNYKDTSGSSGNAYHGLYAGGTSVASNFICKCFKLLIP